MNNPSICKIISIVLTITLSVIVDLLGGGFKELLALLLLGRCYGFHMFSSDKQIYFKDKKEKAFKVGKDSNLVVVTKERNALKYCQRH